MLRAFAYRLALTAAVACTLALTTSLFAAPGPADTKEKEATPAEKIKKQLDQPITLEVTDQSLNAALNQIREQTKINLVVDRFTIQQMGMDPEQLIVSVKLKDVKARSCLRSVLSPYNLGYAIIGDSVLVSTDDMAIFRQMKQRVSIDLEKVDLPTALKKLSKDTAANVMLDSRVTGKETKAEVTLQMEDVPLETAVRLMAEMAGLKPVRVGNVLFVTTKQSANELRAEVEPNGPGGQPPPTAYIEQSLPAIPAQPPNPLVPQPLAPPPNPPPLEKKDQDKTGDNGDKVEKSEPPPKPDKP
jgi:type II secretory pathway component GspD/PulD (secretin)